MIYKRLPKGALFSFVFFIFILIILFQEIKYSILTGKICDAESKEPIEGVKVEVKDTELSDETDKNGIYKIKKIPPGEYWIYAFKEGYWEREIKIVLKENQKLTLDFSLVRKQE